MSTQVYTIPPNNDLKNIVKSFFVMEHSETKSQKQYLLPDGLPSFFYLSVSEDVQAHFFETKQEFSLKSGLYVGYANTLVKLQHQKMKVIGVSVFPFYMSILLRTSLTEIMNKFVPVENLIETDVELSTLKNTTSNNPDDLIKLIEEFILLRIAQNPIRKEILGVYELILKSKGNEVNLNDIADGTGYSARYINKLFKKYLGMSPKQFIKLARFNYGLKLIGELNSDSNLTQVALELGYYDQAHFIKDFKNVSGKTPKELLSERESLHKNFSLY
ncbi:helix-turn-helix transcriptional regulator [Aquimarina sp. 2201CG5-10]|uniref:helix-turn-helix domain-containing protein n=1 Tax=Aquimarina callyspongiae TaxID=3098150 RepID=UPI002AB5252E|nr:helix-turn-helix transcriptional regulator [Aquimarina sp. 2201CG5-10]MDY8136991.1 helix-turn-helix transcriptional regulator [Aquimarina sp. 2201CG5-10]